MDAKTLSQNGYTLFNVNEKKLPSSNGFGIKKWDAMSHNELKKRINFNNKMFGMRMGVQGNKKHILSLDFDCCNKNDKGEYETCEETVDLLNTYFSLGAGKTRHGMFTSSTKGNYNVLVDYSNCPKLHKTLLDLKTCKISKTGCGFELLIGGVKGCHQVIPPTMTKCKLSKEFVRERKFLSDEPFKVLLDDDDDVCGFILNYIQSYIDNKKIDKPKVDNKKIDKPKIKKDVKIDLEKNEKIDKVFEPSDNETLEKICNLISPSCLENHKGYLSLIIAMKNSGLTREFAIDFSKRSKKFDEATLMYGVNSPEKFDNFWDYANDDYKGTPLTEATLHKRAKESNEEEYNLLTSWGRNTDKANKSFSNLLSCPNDYDFACLFVALIGDDLMYQPQTDKEDEKLYLYHENKWKEDIKPHYLTKKIIFNVLSKYTINQNIEYYKLLAEIDKDEDEDKYESILKKVRKAQDIIFRLKQVGTKDTIVKAVKEELAGTENKIEFDKNPDLFSFNNKCFDLRTNKEHIPTKHDYILMRTGDDYKEPTKEQMDKIKELVELVLPDAEVRKCYMSILRSGMRGQTLEKFTMANGCGRNGKTFLHELVFKFMGNYAIKGNVSIITQKMKSGPNPELANLDKKRLVLWAEPEENQSIQISTMKDLTGGDTITAKQCHSNKTEQINHGTHIMELNERVGFDGKLNLAVVERMIDVEFPSFFTYDPIQYNDPEFNNGHCYKRDDSLKEPKFKDEHSCALFHYIMEYEGCDELYVAEAVKERTKAYLNSKDEFTSWFSSVYEIAWNDEKDHEKGRDMKEVIKLSDVYDAYKDGDVYKNMSKKECRKMTKARFIEIFSSHINFKHYYSLRTKVDGATYRNVLRGFKRKEDCDNDFEEEEE